MKKILLFTLLNFILLALLFSVFNKTNDSFVNAQGTTPTPKLYQSEQPCIDECGAQGLTCQRSGRCEEIGGGGGFERCNGADGQQDLCNSEGNVVHYGCSNFSCSGGRWECGGPIPTAVPKCGGPCTPNSTQCPIECPYCFGEFGYNPTCRPAVTQTPEPSPSGPPEKSPTPKTSPTPKSSPTPKVTTTPKPTSTPKPTKTPTPTPKATSTPTPTPFPFADAMCKCDGLEIGQVISGQNLTVTAYGKVEGSDTSYAKIKSFRFFAAKGDSGSPDITIFDRSGPIAAQILNTSQSLVRSQAQWSFKFPANPEVGKEYRIWNDIQCERNTAGIPIASSGKSTQTVLSENTQNISLMQKFLNFVLGIFGRSPNQTTESSKKDFVVTTQSDDNNQLQLGTFKFGRIIDDPETACYMVKITFDK